jgi:hypothetical protein
MVELTSAQPRWAVAVMARLVAEGARLLAGYGKAELSVLRRYLVAAKEITDVHRRSLAPAPARNAQQRPVLPGTLGPHAARMAAERNRAVRTPYEVSHPARIVSRLVVWGPGRLPSGRPRANRSGA